MPPTSSCRRFRDSLLLIAVVLPVYILTTSGRHYSVDGMAMYQQAKTILFRHTLEFSPPFQWKSLVANYTHWPEGMSLLYLVPLSIQDFVLQPAGAAFHVIPSGDALLKDPGYVYMTLTNPLITALAAVVTYLLALAVGQRRGTALFAALVFAFASPAFAYQKQDFAQPLVTLFLTAAVFLFVTAASADTLSSRVARYAAGGFSLGFLLMTRSDALMTIAPAFVVAFAIRARKKSRHEAALTSVAFLVPVLAMGTIHTIISAIKTGSGLGIRSEWISGVGALLPVATAAGGLLVSPGRGLFVYFPLAIFAMTGLRRMFADAARRESAWLLAAILLANLVLFSVWPMWWGGVCWGPRFLTPLLPILTILALWRSPDAPSAPSPKIALAKIVFIAWGFATVLIPVLLRWEDIQAQHAPPAESESWSYERQGAWYFRPGTNELLTGWRWLFHPGGYDLMLRQPGRRSMVVSRIVVSESLVLAILAASLLLARRRERSRIAPDRFEPAQHA